MTSSPRRLLADDAVAPDRRRVFVDVGVLMVSEPSPDRRHDGRRVIAPGAADAIQLLLESHEVVVIADAPLEDVDELVAASTSPRVPDAFPTGSWYITGDGAWCEGDRPSGLRSILVGPRRPPGRRPTLRCDIEARDLSAAVMEILVRETMAYDLAGPDRSLPGAGRNTGAGSLWEARGHLPLSRYRTSTWRSATRVVANVAVSPLIINPSVAPTMRAPAGTVMATATGVSRVPGWR
jgi:hypothetical protein